MKTIERQVHFGNGAGRGKRVQDGPVPESIIDREGKIPHVSKLMALALRFDALVRTGAITNYTELARLGHVSRARVTQILNLVNLAPDIQEAILFLPRTQRGRASVILRHLQPIAVVTEWAKQRQIWAGIRRI